MRRRAGVREPIVVCGIDPGLATFGLALVQVSYEMPTVLRFDVHTSKPDPRKREVTSADDLVDRTARLAMFLEGVLLKPPRARAFLVEALSYPRSSSAAAKIALSWGVLVGFATSCLLPIVVASPQRVRDRVVGASVKGGKRQRITKEEVEAAVARKAVISPGAWDSLDCILERDREHAWDAAAVALALLDSPVVRALR